MAEEMIYNTYGRFMIRHAEGRRRKIVEYDDYYVDDENPMFGRINGFPRCIIALHFTPTKNRRKNSDGTETQYLLQGEFKVCRKKTAHVCSECAYIDAVKN